MFDGTLNLTIDNHLIPTVISGLSEQTFVPLTHFSFENVFSHLSDTEISALTERIEAQSISVHSSTFFEDFAAWLGRLQTNQALADDLTDDEQSESFLESAQDFILNYKSNPNNSLKVGYAIAGIDLEDDLFS